MAILPSMAFLSVVVVVTYGIMTIGRPLVNLVHSERSPLCWTRVLINNLIQLMDTVTSICVAGQIYHHGGITGPFARGSHVTLKVSITYQLNKMGPFFPRNCTHDVDDSVVSYRGLPWIHGRSNPGTLSVGHHCRNSIISVAQLVRAPLQQ